MQTFTAGFFFSLSLIVAIGAQNAFVLRQGLLRQHVFATCLFCAVSDAILITLGVGGADLITSKLPWLMQVMRWGGAAFLLVYGLRAFRSAWTGAGALQAAGIGAVSLRRTLLTIAALTWLNPHVYLDTLVLLGAVSSNFADKSAFAIGAVLASLSFFFALGYGARLLAPIFAKPGAWRVLDLCVGLIMWAIALGLILKG